MIPHMTPADPIPDVLPDTCLLAALIQCLSANICDYSEDEAVEQFPMGVRSVIRCLLTISDDPELRHLFPDRIFIMIRILWNELAPRLTGPRRYMFKASVPQYILK
jgi:hypothetical protein